MFKLRGFVHCFLEMCAWSGEHLNNIAHQSLLLNWPIFFFECMWIACSDRDRNYKGTWEGWICPVMIITWYGEHWPVLLLVFQKTEGWGLVLHALLWNGYNTFFFFHVFLYCCNLWACIAQEEGRLVKLLTMEREDSLVSIAIQDKLPCLLLYL